MILSNGEVTQIDQTEDGPEESLHGVVDTGRENSESGEGYGN